MKPVMYLFINEEARMSAGKIGAQAAHAAVEAYRLSDPRVASAGTKVGPAKKELLDAWYKGGHYTKLVMAARDAEHLRSIERYLNDRGFETALIIDEGRTEIDPHTPTALGVQIVDKDDEHTAATFGDFKTFRSPRPKLPAEERAEVEARGEPTRKWFKK